jgi:hypothetical protein
MDRAEPKTTARSLAHQLGRCHTMPDMLSPTTRRGVS